MGDSEDRVTPVIEAARMAWEINGERPEIRSGSDLGRLVGGPANPAIPSVLVLPDERRVECVLDPDSDVADAVDEVRTLVDGGWQVAALLPIQSLGAAHSAFRGLPMHLQGWWRAGGDLKFTAPEVP
jgi:hypothetical protein